MLKHEEISIVLKSILTDSYVPIEQDNTLSWEVIDSNIYDYILTQQLDQTEMQLFKDIVLAMQVQIKKTSGQHDNIFKTNNSICCFTGRLDKKTELYVHYKARNNNISWVFMPTIREIRQSANLKKELWEYIVQYVLHR